MEDKLKLVFKWDIVGCGYKTLKLNKVKCLAAITNFHSKTGKDFNERKNLVRETIHFFFGCNC